MKDTHSARTDSKVDRQTITDFGDQWTRYTDNSGYYGSLGLFTDICAPLLAVESDPERRDRITFAMGPAELEATPRAAVQALSARHSDGARIATIIVPLYLDFVQVLACAYRPERGFSWVRHDPIVDAKHAPAPGDVLEGAVLERTPLKALIDDLSHAVLSQRRGGRELPEALRVFADLFGPNIGGSTPPPSSAP